MQFEETQTAEQPFQNPSAVQSNLATQQNKVKHLCLDLVMS